MLNKIKDLISNAASFVASKYMSLPFGGRVAVTIALFIIVIAVF